MTAAPPDLFRAARVPLLLSAALFLLAGCGATLPAAEPSPPPGRCDGEVCGSEASRCPLCGESPCVGGCPACDLAISDGGSGPFADSRDAAPVDPPSAPRASVDPSRPTVALITAEGCPPCETAARVAAEAEAAGVQVLVVKVALGGAATPTWARVDFASALTGPLDAARVAALASDESGLSPLPGSPPLPPGHRILRREPAPAVQAADPPPAPRPLNGPGCRPGMACPRR